MQRHMRTLLDFIGEAQQLLAPSSCCCPCATPGAMLLMLLMLPAGRRLQGLPGGLLHQCRQRCHSRLCCHRRRLHHGSIRHVYALCRCQRRHCGGNALRAQGRGPPRPPPRRCCCPRWPPRQQCRRCGCHRGRVQRVEQAELNQGGHPAAAVPAQQLTLLWPLPRRGSCRRSNRVVPGARRRAPAALAVVGQVRALVAMLLLLLVVVWVVMVCVGVAMPPAVLSVCRPAAAAASAAASSAMPLPPVCMLPAAAAAPAAAAMPSRPSAAAAAAPVGRLGRPAPAAAVVLVVPLLSTDAAAPAAPHRVSSSTVPASASRSRHAATPEQNTTTAVAWQRRCEHRTRGQGAGYSPRLQAPPWRGWAVPYAVAVLLLHCCSCCTRLGR